MTSDSTQQHCWASLGQKNDLKLGQTKLVCWGMEFFQNNSGWLVRKNENKKKKNTKTRSV